MNEEWMPKHRHIGGGDAARVANDHAERELVRLPSKPESEQLIEVRKPSAEQVERKLLRD
jgi:hypothetical protein